MENQRVWSEIAYNFQGSFSTPSEKGVFVPSINNSIGSCQGNLKTAHQMLSVDTTSQNFESRITAHIGLFLRETHAAGKSRDGREVIVYEKLRLQNVFRQHENEKLAFSFFFPQLRFHDRLVWTGRPDSNKYGCVFKFLQRTMDGVLQ